MFFSRVVQNVLEVLNHLSPRPFPLMTFADFSRLQHASTLLQISKRTAAFCSHLGAAKLPCSQTPSLSESVLAAQNIYLMACFISYQHGISYKLLDTCVTHLNTFATHFWFPPHISHLFQYTFPALVGHSRSSYCGYQF